MEHIFRDAQSSAELLIWPRKFNNYAERQMFRPLLALIMARFSDDNGRHGHASGASSSDRDGQQPSLSEAHQDRISPTLDPPRPVLQHEKSGELISSEGQGNGESPGVRRGQREQKKFASHFRRGGKLRPFRLLKEDFNNFTYRYVSDWTVFNQLVLASTVYVFFTNLLPGITFAGDLYALTGESWGTIEVVFSTGLCGVVFAL